MRGRKWAAVTNGHKQKNRGCVLTWDNSLVAKRSKDSASERNDGQGLEFEVKRWTPNLMSRLLSHPEQEKGSSKQASCWLLI